MFLINSRSHLIIATFLGSCRKGSHPKRCTFFRSYGAILPSSFTRVLSSALVFSTCPPVLVWGTVTNCLKLRDFSWKRGISYFSSKRASTSHLRLNSRLNPKNSPTCLNQDNQRLDNLAFSVLPSQQFAVQEY
jgi:hypothetical protein